MEQEIRRTVQIKLRQTPEQADEIEKLFYAFGVGLNFSLKQIEAAYQKAVLKYRRVEDVDGVCAGCGKERPLIYSSEGKLFCNTCVMREYSEYTVRGMSISTPDRPVENDLKVAVDVENKTHLHIMFSQAYATWKSFNAWRNKREFEKKYLMSCIEDMKKDDDMSSAVHVAHKLLENAENIYRADRKKTMKYATALATKDMASIFPHVAMTDVAKVVSRLRRIKALNRPVHFPDFQNVTSIQLHKNFVTFTEGKLHVSLFHKKNNGQVIDYYSNEYLNQFLSTMEEDNNVYTNLIKRVDGKKVSYYMMYPLTVKHNIPTILDLADKFTICFSPEAVLVHSNHDGKEIVKFFQLGNLLKVKNHFINKRSELMAHHTRNSLRRLKKMGNSERRATRTYNHQLSHDIIEYINGYIFSIECDDIEKLLSQDLTGLKSQFRAEGIMLSKSTSVTKVKPNEWAVTDGERGYILRKEQKDLINVYVYRSTIPLIVMWDMTTGITADYGKVLNRTKKLWPVVQQQEFIKHKAFLRCIPVKMVKYNKQNVLTCSFCHKPFKKKDEFGKDTKDTIKTITALLHRIKNIKCEHCGHELNMVVNQARLLSAVE